MPRIQLDSNGCPDIPPAIRRRHGLAPGEPVFLEETDAGLVIHPLRPDVRKIYLEVTTRCNFACRTCIRNVWSDPLEDMAEATFDRLATQMGELPWLSEVVFGGYGEPFVHPHLLDFIQVVKGMRLKVSITTNGSLLDESCAEALVRLGVDTLTVSLDGVDPATFADVRRDADLTGVLGNLETLNQIKERYKTPLPRLNIEFVALKRNISDLPLLPRLAARLKAAHVLVTNVLPYTPEMAADALYNRDATDPLIAPTGWPVRSDDWLLWGAMDLPRMNWGAERRCRFVSADALVIGWDGKVSPCYALSHSYTYYIFGRRKEVTRYVLGDIGESTLAQIWTADEYVRFRAEVRRFHFPSCVDCDLRDKCDIAAANEGCWGWCPSCADCLWAQDIVRCP